MLVQVADVVIVVMMHNKQTQLSMVYHTDVHIIHLNQLGQAGPQAYGYVQVQDSD